MAGIDQIYIGRDRNRRDQQAERHHQNRDTDCLEPIDRRHITLPDSAERNGCRKAQPGAVDHELRRERGKQHAEQPRDHRFDLRAQQHA